MARCTGHCCRRFRLPACPEKLRDPNERRYIDHDILVDMLIPLGADVMPPGSWAGRSTKLYHYTCRHLSEAGDCGIYKTRPDMCRLFPGGAGARCGQAGCTSDRANPDLPWGDVTPGGANTEIVNPPFERRERLCVVAPDLGGNDGPEP